MSTKITPKKKTPATHRKVERMESVNSGIAVHTSFSGPIPQASELAKYNDVIPDAAERILRMAEKNQEHQINMEIAALNAHRREVRRGQVFALIITTTALGSAVIAIFQNLPYVAGVIGGTTVVGLALAFIKGKSATK